MRQMLLAAQLLGAMENRRAEVWATVHVGMARAITHATTSVVTALCPSLSERTVESQACRQ